MTTKPSGARFERLVEIMATLREPGGCPWDREQDLDTLKPMLLEEAYEVVDAVENRDYDGLAEELGDLLLHVVFHARLCEEAGRFGIGDVVDGICDKLIRRHPHVFGDDDASDPDQVLANWEAIKKREKQARNERLGRSRTDGSILDGIPANLPALYRAHKVSSRAVRAGFDWPDVEGVFEKLEEEIAELREAMARRGGEGARERIEGELGDAFFVLVNIARFLDVDSESALRRSTRKFERRFRYVEDALARRGRTLEEATLDDMEAIWQEAKRGEA